MSPLAPSCLSHSFSSIDPKGITPAHESPSESISQESQAKTRVYCGIWEADLKIYMKAKFKNSQEIAKEEQSWEMGVGVGGSCTIRCQNFVIKI